MAVYSIIAAGAIRYIRAKSAEQARVRGYKCFGQPFKVTKIGNWIPDSVGERGYNEWVREPERAERAMYYPPVADEAEKTAMSQDEIAKLFAMLKA